ncbi:MAG: hypothetical protein ACREBS_11550 [Nitrososphaerales archaeon]
MNNETDVITIDNVFNFLRQLFVFMRLRERETKKFVPIHLLNVDELGYAAYSNRAANFSSPIATSPYVAHYSAAEDEDRDLSGGLYHPIDMIAPKLSTVKDLFCRCKECRKFETIARIPLEYRPIFRRVHWLNVKDDEVRQFRDTPACLDIALRDKFANSKRTGLVAHIPRPPIFVDS